MDDSSNRPLLTFAIGAYNQEPFVREAVEAAFAQTYSPLEIILSDDCSADRTFEIMREMAAAYRGPHRVILNRNPQQLSIGGHINRLVELSRGELIVGAAGDDVSAPERAQAAWEAWEKTGRKATSIHSSYVQIDERGNEIGKVLEPGVQQSATVEIVEQDVDPVAYVQTLEPIVFGCTHTFARQLFRTFGNLPPQIIHEDNALALRSSLAGKIVYIRRPLVKYRVHGSNIYIRSRERAADLKTLESQEQRLCRDLKNRETMCQGFLLDLECARRNGLISPEKFDQAYAIAARKKLRFAMQQQFLGSGIVGKCSLLLPLWRTGLTPQEKVMLIRRLLPRSVLVRIRLASAHAAAARQRSHLAKMQGAIRA
jgi:glycosyltransferase involved in cell wall biosynthesis